MKEAHAIGLPPEARSEAYSFLALAFSSPHAGHADSLTRGHERLRRAFEAQGDLSIPEVVVRLGPLLSSLDDAALARAYTQCFGHAISKDCPPYEAEYGQAHIFQKTHTLADIAGFYHAFGLDLAAHSHERPDHLSVELEFMHFLCTKEAYALARNHPHEKLALCREAQSKFLREHLCRWAFGFARRLCAKAGDAIYQELAQLLAAFLAAELREIGLEPDDVGGPDFVEEWSRVSDTAAAAESTGCGAVCGVGSMP